MKTIFLSLLCFSLLTSCLQKENAEKARFSASSSNSAPTVGANQSVSVTEDTPVSFTLNAGSDANGNTLSYLAVTTPALGTISHCMNLTSSTGSSDLSCLFTPTANATGTTSFTYKVNDGTVDSASLATVTLVITGVDDTPIGSLSSVTLSYSDGDGDLATSCSLSSLINLTETIACTCSFGVCQATLTPSANLNGTIGFSFSYSVVAGGTTSALQNVNVVVTAVNDTPLITVDDNAGSTTLAQNAAFSTLSWTVTGTDPVEGNSLTYSLGSSHTCSWLTINGTTGVLSGTPTNDDVGTCDVQVKVDDGQTANNTANSTPITLTITNVAAVIPACAALAGTEDTTFTNDFSAGTGEEGSVGEYSLTDVDCGTYGTLSLENAGTGIVKFIPTSNLPSACSFTLGFDEDNDGVDDDTETCNLAIAQANDAPTFSVATIANQTATENTTFYVDFDSSTLGIQSFTLDEGGGADEDTQGLTLEVVSSDATILPNNAANIDLFDASAMGVELVPGGVAAHGGVVFNTIDLGDLSSNDGTKNLMLKLVPAFGQTGTVTLSLYVNDGSLESVKTFTVNFTNVSAVHAGWTAIKGQGTKVLRTDSSLLGDSSHQIVLGWNAFTMSNSNILGYRVFRSTSATGPFLIPQNSTLVSASARTYTDTDFDASHYGSVFYYKVMAVDATYSALVDTAESFNVVLAELPEPNMTFLSRRMMNKETCARLNLTSDLENHNRCTYTGLGATGAPTSYFDIGADYTMDRFEASCNYTFDPTAECTETGGAGCITRNSVTAVTGITASIGSLLYERESATCYLMTTGGWMAANSLQAVCDGDDDDICDFISANHLNQNGQSVLGPLPKAPPLVKVTQARAGLYCSEFNNTSFATTKALPSRTLMLAASAWSSSLSASTQQTYEAGAALSSGTSRCNSSNGGSLSFSNSLSSALTDQWPSTFGSAHRLVMSGSTVTATCASTYGVQDLIGNAREWTSEVLVNNGDTQIDPSGSHGALEFAGGTDFLFSGVNAAARGPNLLTVTTNTPFTSFTDKYFYPATGIPGLSLSTGISAQSAVTLNGDGIQIEVSSSTDNLGLTFGGGYSAGDLAGRYYLGVRNTTSTPTDAQTGFRCVRTVVP
jgi:hypothetical protein